jgi:hypothetical protein
MIGMRSWMKLGWIVSIPLSIFPSLTAPWHPVVLVCTSTAHLVLIMYAGGMFAEMFQISVHLTESQVAMSNPAVDRICNLAETLGMTAFVAGFETTYHKEIAVDHLV